MVDPKQFHTWVHFLLLHLFILLTRHGAEAQSPIQPEPPFATHQSWDPSVAVIVGALFCAFLIVGLFSVYLRRCAESYVAERNPVGGGTAVDWPCSCSKGINREILDKFPILFYSTIKDLKIGKGALECAVCLNEFKDYETLRLLPKCNHVFHPDCIDAWLSSHVTCPVCRANLNQDLGKFAINLETQLNANQVYDENSDNTAEQSGDVNEIERNPVTPNSNEGQRNAEEDAGKQNLPSRSNILGKFLRSNSTGHSLVEPGKCLDRYTLRLPEDVRTYILLNHEMKERSASYNVVISSRKGLCSSDGEGSSRGKKINVEGSSRGKRSIVELWQERRVLPRTPPLVGVEGSSVAGNSSNTCSALPVFCSWPKNLK